MRCPDMAHPHEARPEDWSDPHEACAGEDDTLTWWGMGLLVVIVVGLLVADTILIAHHALVQRWQR